MVTGFFDETPIDQPLPYISISTITETPWQMFGHINADILMVADIWFLWAGDSEGLMLLAEVKRVLVPLLETEHYTVVTSVCEWSSTMKDQDENVGHIPFRYHFQLEEKIGV